MTKVYLTRAGLRKLEGELRLWKNNRLPEMIKRVSEARGHGDLSENAEYHAAREELNRIIFSNTMFILLMSVCAFMTLLRFTIIAYRSPSIAVASFINVLSLKTSSSSRGTDALLTK